MFKKTIISEFFTTISFSQSLNSLYLMTFGFKKLKNGNQKSLFEKNFLSYIGKEDKKIISFYNARSAIFHCIKMLGLKSSDEIIVSSYNCSVVVNAVIQAGSKIVYSDIEKFTLGLDLFSVKNNIKPNTKAIIIQHTFGKKMKFYDEIIDLAKFNGIYVIEDCAHAIFKNFNYKGDFQIFSSGRDKVISTITGGFLIFNNNPFSSKVDSINSLLKGVNYKLIYQNLFYNISGYYSYKLYDFFGFGKIIIYISLKFRLISSILNYNEKNFKDKSFFNSFPNSFATLGISELKKLDEYINARIKNSLYYLKNIKNSKINFVFENIEDYSGFRFPIILDSVEEKIRLINLGKKYKIIFGSQWSGQNIIPSNISLKKAEYNIGSCKNSEDLSSRILTLPNHTLMNDNYLKRVVSVLNQF